VILLDAVDAVDAVDAAAATVAVAVTVTVAAAVAVTVAVTITSINTSTTYAPVCDAFFWFVLHRSSIRSSVVMCVESTGMGRYM
jgi:hypothetical protein